MRHLDRHAARPHLRIGEHLGEVVDRPARHLGRLERVEPVAARAALQRRREQRHQHRAVAHAVGVAREARIARPARAQPATAQKRRELAVVADRQDHVAVGGLEHLVGHDVRVRVAGALRRDAGGQVAGAEVGEHRDLRVEQRHVDLLALAGARRGGAARPGSRSSAYMPVNRSATATPTFCGPPPGASSAISARDGPVTLISPPMPWIGVVVAGALAVRAGLAEAGDRAVDEARVEREQRGARRGRSAPGRRP